MKYYLLLVFSGLLFLTSCTNEEDLPDPANPNDDLSIQVHNISDFDFKDLKINTGGGEHTYGSVASTQISDPALFQSAYRYCYVELKIDEDLFVLQPIDYVGETKIEDGEIIYEVDVIDYMSRSLSIRIQ